MAIVFLKLPHFRKVTAMTATWQPRTEPVERQLFSGAGAEVVFGPALGMSATLVLLQHREKDAATATTAPQH
jgi:hypothetical protein